MSENRVCKLCITVYANLLERMSACDIKETPIPAARTVPISTNNSSIIEGGASFESAVYTEGLEQSVLLHISFLLDR